MTGNLFGIGRGDPLRVIRDIFDRNIVKHGPSAKGVYWKNPEGQVLRYEILLGIIGKDDLGGGIFLNDLGCGYGAMFDIIADDPLMQNSRYFGYDLSGEMIRHAKSHTDDPRAQFFKSDHALHVADYSFASGTFNMHAGQDNELWKGCVLESLRALWLKTRKGMAFNMLDKNHPESLKGLYYADRDIYLDFCRTELSPNVELVTDYPLEEWSIFVRR